MSDHKVTIHFKQGGSTTINHFHYAKEAEKTAAEMKAKGHNVKITKH